VQKGAKSTFAVHGRLTLVAGERLNTSYCPNVEHSYLYKAQKLVNRIANNAKRLILILLDLWQSKPCQLGQVLTPGPSLIRAPV
jgi:hypothetical protein